MAKGCCCHKNLQRYFLDKQKVIHIFYAARVCAFSPNNLSSTINTIEDLTDNEIPVVELNVGVGENIAEALEEKLAVDNSLNRSFQPRYLSSQLDKFNFELPPQNSSSEPRASIPIVAEAPNITDQELQLVAETTEATNNIINETITKMLAELGDDTSGQESIQLVSSANGFSVSNEENEEINEPFVFSNALSSAQKLRQVEDIRAIFEILGIGS